MWGNSIAFSFVLFLGDVFHKLGEFYSFHQTLTWKLIFIKSSQSWLKTKLCVFWKAFEGNLLFSLSVFLPVLSNLVKFFHKVWGQPCCFHKTYFGKFWREPFAFKKIVWEGKVLSQFLVGTQRNFPNFAEKFCFQKCLNYIHHLSEHFSEVSRLC